MKPGLQAKRPVSTYLLNQRASTALSYLLVALMLVCALVPLIRLGERLAEGWDGDYLLLFCGVVALEAMIAWRTASRLSILSQESILYRLTEFVVIFVGLKAYIYNHRGWAQLWSDLPRWQNNFGEFFSGEYIFACLLVGLVWAAATRFADTLVDLEGDEYLLSEAREAGVQSDRAGARRRLMGDIFVIGGVMLFFTAIQRSNLALFGLPLPVAQAGLLNVVLYFVLGLVLLAQSQFAVLRARWGLERIPLSGNIAPRWAIYSALLLVVCAAIAVFLPTRYSLGLLDTLAFLLALAQFLIYLLLLLIVLPIQFLLSLLRPGQPAPEVAPPPLAQPLIAGEPAAAIPWFEIIRSIIFWTLLIGLIGFSLYYYLRERSGLLAALRRLPGWAWLAGFWGWLAGGVRHLNQRLAEAVAAVVNRSRRADDGTPWGFINLRRLSPRDQVRFYYLALVRRATEQGLPRRLSQTPYEYASDLASRLPETDDLDALTSAFVEAQYSRHAVLPPVANAVRRHWENLKQILRSLRR